MQKIIRPWGTTQTHHELRPELGHPIILSLEADLPDGLVRVCVVAVVDGDAEVDAADADDDQAEKNRQACSLKVLRSETSPDILGFELLWALGFELGSGRARA